jgi:N-acetylmuramoyl-L-alanine amidase
MNFDINTHRRIDEIFVHCSATREGEWFDVENIRQWHLNRGFSDVGYHFVVLLDGKIQEGRPVSMMGAHAKGYNRNSIGICYIGGVAQDNSPKDTRTEEQKESILKLLKYLKKKYPDATIRGHREVANKACPSFDAKEEYKDL